MNSNRSGGLCAVAFAVLTLAALFVEAPPGGSYSQKTVANFTASGHRPLVLVAIYLGIAAGVALLGLIAHLHARTASATRRLLIAGAGGMSAVSLAIGFAVAGAVPIGLMFGGGNPIEPRITYMIIQAGMTVTFGVAMTCVGIALLAAAPSLPGWMTPATYVAGVAGIASFAWIPFFLVVLWGLVVGAVLARRSDEPADRPRIPGQAAPFERNVVSST